MREVPPAPEFLPPGREDSPQSLREVHGRCPFAIRGRSLPQSVQNPARAQRQNAALVQNMVFHEPVVILEWLGFCPNRPFLAS